MKGDATHKKKVGKAMLQNRYFIVDEDGWLDWVECERLLFDDTEFFNIGRPRNWFSRQTDSSRH